MPVPRHGIPALVNDVNDDCLQPTHPGNGRHTLPCWCIRQETGHKMHWCLCGNVWNAEGLSFAQWREQKRAAVDGA